jgi:hypothetical protein
MQVPSLAQIVRNVKLEDSASVMGRTNVQRDQQANREMPVPMVCRAHQAQLVRPVCAVMRRR